MTPSPKLQIWLDSREQHLEVKRRIADDGGHLMLRSESYDPDAFVRRQLLCPLGDNYLGRFESI